MNRSWSIRLLVLLLFSACVFSLQLVPVFGRGEITYPTSPRDIVIQVRTEPTGGFRMMKLTAVPEFTLYGDGRVIYSRVDERRNVQMYESRLTPDEIRQLLTFVNRQRFNRLNDNYLNLTLTELETTYITVNTCEYQKTVKAYGIRLASYQDMLPVELERIYQYFTTFRRDDECPYIPDRISLYVTVNRTPLPTRSRVIKWNVQGVNLEKIAIEEPQLTERYQETVITGEEKDRILQAIGACTLFTDRTAFLNNFFKQGKCLYKVSFRPHLPYE